MTEIAAYGTWKSPISAADVARGTTRVGFPSFAGDEVWWRSGREEAYRPMAATDADEIEETLVRQGRAATLS